MEDCRKIFIELNHITLLIWWTQMRLCHPTSVGVEILQVYNQVKYVTRQSKTGKKKIPLRAMVKQLGHDYPLASITGHNYFGKN